MKNRASEELHGQESLEEYVALQVLDKCFLFNK